jgi:hypothetical protein
MLARRELQCCGDDTRQAKTMLSSWKHTVAQDAPRLLGMVAKNVYLHACGRAQNMKLFTDLPMAPRITSAST